MDTRYWGPSGWQLLHLIAEEYPDMPKKQDAMHYELFFQSMKDVLPCRFCRESTSNFMAQPEFSLHSALASKHALTRWLYDLHNRVNKKLRDQCAEDPRVICPPPDPSFEAVRAVYENLTRVTPTAIPGVDFLYAIVYNYPKTAKEITSDKLRYYFDFFINLSHVYPYTPLRKILQSHIHEQTFYSVLQSRSKLMQWFDILMRKLAQKTGGERPGWNTVAYYASGCQKKTYRGKTCRNGRKVRNHKKTFKITHARLVTVS
jgi:hypothetical protein